MTQKISIGISALFLIIASTANSTPAARYELTLTNGSQMPISPTAIYVKNGGEPSAAIGSIATSGFIQLCQTGNPMMRINELKLDPTITFTSQTTGLIMPGETKVVEVSVMNPDKQSIHFEAMYGKSKDTCGVGTVNSHSLVALAQHVTSEVVNKDNTVLTGAFTEPTLPTGMTYLEPSVCANSMNAVSCLRELSMPISGSQIRYFSGYSPRLISALEVKYGSADVQSLIFPTSGAIQYKLKLKH